MEKNVLDHSTPIALYFQLKSLILRDIQKGVYPIGTQIPTEMELQASFGVSRATIRHALNELVNEGWLERKASKGTFVSQPKKTRNVFRSFEPFYQRVEATGQRHRNEVLEMAVIEADEMLAEAMKLRPGEKVVTMFRRRYIEDDAVVTIRNFLPFSICGFILSHDFREESLYEVLMQNPLSKIAKTRSIVSAQRSTPEDLKLLGIKKDTPMLVFSNTAVTGNGTVVDYAFTRYRGDLSSFELESSPE